jgi:hypothetical protein
MLWPPAWKSAELLRHVQGTSVDCLLLEESAGLHVMDSKTPPADIAPLEGEWPGVQMSRGSGGGVSAGPTGAPWINSNGWKIRLETLRKPDRAVWVRAMPKSAQLSGGSYRLAVADGAAYGGRWVIALDESLAGSLGQDKPEALQTWKQLTAAAAFFARSLWSAYAPLAVIGVASDFAGDNEFLSQELLNLIARANQQYRILFKDRIAPADLKGLRAVLYPDAQAPAGPLRDQLLDFVQGGGLLITGPKWGSPPGAPAASDHPDYDFRRLGKGRVAIARSDLADPYIVANDAALLMSHRYELLRFWNSGANGSYLLTDPRGSRAVAHLLFYANRGPDYVSLRIAGTYSKAMLKTIDQPHGQWLEVERQKDGVEVHLPAVAQYAALELER